MIKRFGSGGPYEDAIGYSRVVQTGSLSLTAGCTAVVDGELQHVGDAYHQAIVAFGVGLDALAAAGCPPENVVSSRMYVARRSDIDAVARAHSAVFDKIRPTSALILVAGFVDERMLVEIELVGAAP